MDDGDFQVVSWDAPISQLFFGIGDDGFTVDGELAVRRTFDHRLDDIADLEDEWIVPLDPSPFAAAELHVPAPARAQGRRVRGEQNGQSGRPKESPDAIVPSFDPAAAAAARSVEWVRD